MNHKNLLIGSTLALGLNLVPAHGQTGSHAGHAAAVAADLADGEVRRIDKEGGRLTLKHGEIKSLDMPPMTMVFQVQPPALLEALKVGDKVRFKAVSEGGKYTVTEIKPVK